MRCPRSGSSRSSRCDAPLLQVVDLLPVALADVADVEVAGRAVEREPPRVAQAVRDDAASTASVASTFEPHDLRERPREALAVVLRVAAAAAVAVPPVEPACRGRTASWPPLWFDAKSLTKSSCFADDAIARRAVRAVLARRACRRSRRCSRRRSGGSSRSPGRTRPTAAPARRPLCTMRADVEERRAPDLAARAARGSGPPARRRRGCRARRAPTSRRPARRSARRVRGADACAARRSAGDDERAARATSASGQSLLIAPPGRWTT